MSKQTQSIEGVQDNFLATFSSRHTSHNGYWLFGQALFELSGFAIDLFRTPPAEPGSLREVTARLAALRFADQLVKARLDPARIATATLGFSLLPGEAHGLIRGARVAGTMVRFTCVVEMGNGATRRRHRDVFVAFHDPGRESRRRLASLRSLVAGWSSSF